MTANAKLDRLREKKAFFTDIDGTLMLDNQPLTGATEFVNKLVRQGRLFYILTNNSSKTPQEYLEKFSGRGFNITEKNILISIQAALLYFKQNRIDTIYWVANRNVANYLSDNGFKFEVEHPQAILLTYDTELNYDKLTALTFLVRRGIPYYATHNDIVCPTKQGGIPDVGTFIKVIQMATGILPGKIFGKPDKSFIEPVLIQDQIRFDEAVIIGDRLYTDIKLAENSALTSVLVLSGETNREMYESGSIRADIVVDSIANLIEYI